ncbi:uncharacterized protein DUF2778 [Roseiarcus fermentans]|uniref:Uncharacterized protein DUF2778 n=1 Tax=Roseiarcus fermentans TaxID=1473586 RepID=A0A366F9F0_9HYPH|nr:tlde1 domain-containing protein [Roseiarcus fermentans]RBP10590.1 uncharacterized protein DUF2778 [Roseiarcus fermentans]
MQGIDAAIGGIPLERGRNSGRAARHVILGAVAAATVGCVAAYALHQARYGSAPVVAKAPVDAPVTAEDPEKLFGALIVEPEWRAQANAPAPSPTLASLAPEQPAAPTPADSLRLETPPPAPPPQSAPPASVNALPDVIPLPPIRDVPRIDESVPLPPVRPSDFAEPAPNPVAPERQIALPAPGSAAPGDGRNIFQKLLGIGQQPGAVVASRPPAPPSRPTSAPPAAEALPSRPASAPATTVVSKPAAGDARSGIAGLFGAFSSAPSVDHLGYDRQTAIYDISARVVYLPDGTRLEAHSGLGAALDDIRFVSERAVGPTPPHLYELTLRESLFHGVQALRLTPVGDGGVYGRAGLLAHPYMLGPNGDSNGCVSFKDYDAFLRAYQNGQVRKLAVVSRL